MRKLTIFLLLISISSISLSQSKYTKRLNKLYAKQKYEKCITKSNKFLRKQPKSDEIQYYIVASNLQLFMNTSTYSKQNSYLKKTLSSLIKLEKYNKTEHKYNELSDSIHNVISVFVENDNCKSMYFHNKLADYFHDTTNCFINANKNYIVVKHKPEFIDSLAQIRSLILENAENVIGVRYKYGGTDTTGFDCSGFTQYVYKLVGIELPHNANKQSKLGEKINLSNAQPGDLIFFGSSPTAKRAYHAGMIYSNIDGRIELIHCVTGGVQHQSSDDQNVKYWLKRVIAVKKMIDVKIEME